MSNIAYASTFCTEISLESSRDPRHYLSIQIKSPLIALPTYSKQRWEITYNSSRIITSLYRDRTLVRSIFQHLLMSCNILWKTRRCRQFSWKWVIRAVFGTRFPEKSLFMRSSFSCITSRSVEYSSPRFSYSFLNYSSFCALLFLLWTKFFWYVLLEAK